MAMEHISKQVKHLCKTQPNKQSLIVTKKSKEARALVEYADSVEILNRVNPVSLGIKYNSIVSAKQAVEATGTKLSHFTEAYGESVPELILRAYITLLQKFLGVKDDTKLSPEAIEELSKLILSDYNELNVAEVELVFKNIKKGNYGTIYGRLDPVFVVQSFRKYFDNERLAYFRSKQGEVEKLGKTINDVEWAENFLKNEVGLKKRLKRWKTYLCQDCQGDCRRTAEYFIAKEAMNRYVVASWILCWDVEVVCGIEFNNKTEK